MAYRPSVADYQKRFDNEMSRINAEQVGYWPSGPNSNTVVSTMLVRCGWPVMIPESISPIGFNDGTL